MNGTSQDGTWTSRKEMSPNMPAENRNSAITMASMAQSAARRTRDNIARFQTLADNSNSGAVLLRNSYTMNMKSDPTTHLPTTGNKSRMPRNAA